VAQLFELTYGLNVCLLRKTSGDSAKALAVSGLAVVGRDRYGVFPLKGKFLNVREATASQMMANTEVTHLKQILGLRSGHAYTSTRELRYGRVMIMADQDFVRFTHRHGAWPAGCALDRSRRACLVVFFFAQDGSHIKALIINGQIVFFVYAYIYETMV
jgi:hypothetical protein